MDIHTCTCSYTDICSLYIYLLSIYSTSASPTVDSILAHSSLASKDVREKWVVRCFLFPPHGFLRAVSNAEIKGYEDRLLVPLYFLLICSVHPVFSLSICWFRSNTSVCLWTSLRFGDTWQKLHSLSHSPLPLSALSLPLLNSIPIPPWLSPI